MKVNKNRDCCPGNVCTKFCYNRLWNKWIIAVYVGEAFISRKPQVSRMADFEMPSEKWIFKSEYFGSSVAAIELSLHKY